MQLLPPPPGTPSDGSRDFGFCLPQMYAIPAPPAENRSKTGFMRKWMCGETKWALTHENTITKPFDIDLKEREQRCRATLIKDALWDTQYYKNHFVSQLCELIFHELSTITDVEDQSRTAITDDLSDHYVTVTEHRICLNAMPATYEETAVRKTIHTDYSMTVTCLENISYVLGCVHIDQLENKARMDEEEEMLHALNVFGTFEHVKFPDLIRAEIQERADLVRESYLISVPFLEESRQHLQITSLQTRDRAIITASRRTFIHDKLLAAEKDIRGIIFTEWLAWVCNTIASELYEHLQKLITIQRWYRQWKNLQPSRLLLHRKKEALESYKTRLIATEDHTYQNTQLLQQYDPKLETLELDERRLISEKQCWEFTDIQTHILTTAPSLMPRYLLPSVVALDFHSTFDKAIFNIIYEERYRRFALKGDEHHTSSLLLIPGYHFRQRLQHVECEAAEREIIFSEAFTEFEKVIDTCNVDFDCYFMTEIISGWIDGSGIGTDYDIRIAKLTKLTQELVIEEALARDVILQKEHPDWRKLSIWISGAAKNVLYNSKVESEKALFDSKPLAYDLRPLKSGAITGELINMEEHIEPTERSHLMIVESASRCLQEFKLQCAMVRTVEEFEARNLLFNIYLTTQNHRCNSLIRLIQQGIRLKFDAGVLDIEDNHYRRDLEAEELSDRMLLFSHYACDFSVSLHGEESTACIPLEAAHRVIPVMFSYFASSLIIQSRYRGWLARKAYPQRLRERAARLQHKEWLEFESYCASKIQKAWRDKVMLSALMDGLDAEFC